MEIADKDAYYQKNKGKIEEIYFSDEKNEEQKNLIKKCKKCNYIIQENQNQCICNKKDDDTNNSEEDNKNKEDNKQNRECCDRNCRDCGLWSVLLFFECLLLE